MCLGEKDLGYFLLLLRQYEGKIPVTNKLYPSIEKKKSKDQWLHGEKKGVIWHDVKGERDSSSV